MIFVSILTFGLSWWLGLYLLARDFRKPVLLWTGLGLIGYAWAVALLVVVAPLGEMPAFAFLTKLGWGLLFVPAFSWSATLYFSQSLQEIETKSIHIVVFLLIITQLLLTLFTNWFVRLEDGNFVAGRFYLIFAGIIAICMLVAIGFAIKAPAYKQTRPLLFLSTLFFALSIGLIMLPINLIPQNWMVLGLGVDILMLGVVIAYLDAFDEGESLWRDFWRSLGTTALLSVLFAGQVGVVMSLGNIAQTGWMHVLILDMVAVAVFVAVNAGIYQTTLDRLSFSGSPQTQEELALLRATPNALVRRHSHPFADMDNGKFDRLTRKALSQMSNLPRLAAHPFTQLPTVETHLNQRGESDNTLNRANILRTILIESIQRLKPTSEDGFGSTDEWRFYNALHFPYVVGLKPYRRYTNSDGLLPDETAALDWFRTQVPERTLYNWQKAAANLVAQDLREQSELEGGLNTQNAE